MGDDRILFAPPVWAPDPDVLARWPAVRAFLQRVQEHWPVDVVRWPTIKGEPQQDPTGAGMWAAVARVLRPEHHVVFYSMAEAVLDQLHRKPPRSVTATSFVASRGTMLAAGGSLAASTVQMMVEASLRPAQLLPSLFQGADPALIESILKQVEETTKDRHILEWIARRRLAEEEDHSGRWVFDIPALYLASAAPLPGREGMEKAFRTFFPRARSQELELWGVKMHEDAAGEEFAGKVIAFVQEVIAEREKAG